MAEAASRVRTGATEFRGQLRGLLGSGRCRPGGLVPGFGQAASVFQSGLQGGDEGREGIDQGLVTHLGASQTHHRIESGLCSLGHRVRIQYRLIAERRAPGPQRQTPQRAGGATRPVGPGVTSDRQHTGGTGTGCNGLLGGFNRSRRAARHAHAVIAVPGERVDLAQLVLGLTQLSGHD